MQTKIKLGTSTAIVSALLGAFVAASPAMAQSSAEKSVAQFYAGKTIDLLIGLSPGGAYDTYSRLIARTMGKHIPGEPGIVPRNMPGGGGRAVVNHLVSVAPKNGLYMATADRSLALQQAISDPTITFDTTKLNWVGNPSADVGTFTVWSASGINSVEDAKKQEVIIGATGWNATSQVALAMNALLGTKFKIVIGYPGGNDINLAMERGEVAGRASLPWSAWKATRPNWIEDKKIKIIAQIGLERHPEIGDVPLLTELTNDPEKQAVFKLLSAPVALGFPLFTSPDVPPERVKALRAAFDATMKDAEFVSAAEKGGLDLNPLPGDKLQTIVAEIVGAPKSVKDRLAEVITPPR